MEVPTLLPILRMKLISPATLGMFRQTDFRPATDIVSGEAIGTVTSGGPSQPQQRVQMLGPSITPSDLPATA